MTPDRAQFRDTSHYLAAVASEAARPLLMAYARARARRPPAPPQHWRNGVILGAGHLGDVLYRTCSLNALHFGLPACRWTYFTSPAGAELLHGNPALAAVVAIDERGTDVMSQLAAGAFDVALCTDNVQHHRALLAAVRAGIPNRVAFGSKGLTGLATVAVPVARASWPAQFERMVGAITTANAASSLRPHVYLNDDDETAARAAWEALPLRDASLTLALAVTTRQRLGVFPPALFERIVSRVLALEPTARVMLFGSASDRTMLGRLAAAIGDRAVVLPVISVRACVAVLRRCDAFLGSDSGPRHMANAAGIPVFFVRNMAVPEIEAGRYCDTEVDLAPSGQYLTEAANEAALAQINAAAAASALVAAARRCV